jgi:motility quorum-sensing regulator/GCU-specific mRNA interferase toxin
MEKMSATYKLVELKRCFCNSNQLRVTGSALLGARSMGFTRQDMVEVVQQLKESDFVKSMTTFHDHKVWQDIYNTSFNGCELYVKFQKDELGYFVISFKEL